MSVSITTLSADDLLAINVDEPERLFAFDEENARQEWRALSGRWHPDRNPDRQARWVFSHVQDLFQAACRRRASGLWVAPGEIRMQTRAGRCYRLRYRNKYALDLGTVYVGRGVLAYAIDLEYADLAGYGYELSCSLPFADSRMEREMAPFLPQPLELLETRGAQVLVLRKAEEFVALRGLLDHAGGSLPPCHVAWIVSALLNLCCYLQIMGLAHQAIDIDHCLVSPAKHAIGLYGGWWYATAQDSPMHALPARSARLAPPDVMGRKLADVRLDQFLLRAVALELLGEECNRAPAAMRDFLTLPPAANTLADYEQWQQTLWESFGERRFVPLAIDADDIYGMASPTPA